MDVVGEKGLVFENKGDAGVSSIDPGVRDQEGGREIASRGACQIFGDGLPGEILQGGDVDAGGQGSVDEGDKARKMPLARSEDILEE